MIDRIVAQFITKKLFKGKVIVLYGAKQVGKTTMLQNLLKNRNDYRWLNADEHEVQTFFDKPSSIRFKKEFGGLKILVIDEAQRIEDIGVKLKLITDQIPELQLIVSGSSSFELANKITEPLTGRKYEYMLFPLSMEEMVNKHGIMEEQRLLHHRMIYGFYPEVATASRNERELLKLISDSYFYKDILTWNKIQKSDKLIRLLQALAFQVGNQVSYQEIGRKIGLNNDTVEKYISMLEQSFIIFRLGTYSRNLRTELTKTRKIYFYDNGIRNALIANFQEIELRQDIGALWENFAIAERQKYLSNNNIWYNQYFWRTKAQQEVDFLEESNGELNAYEFKWNPNSKGKITKAFTNAYPQAKTQIITNENYLEFFVK